MTDRNKTKVKWETVPSIAELPGCLERCPGLSVVKTKAAVIVNWQTRKWVTLFILLGLC